MAEVRKACFSWRSSGPTALSHELANSFRNSTAASGDAVATSILRLGTFPLLVKNQKNVAKLMELQPQIEKLMEEINRLVLRSKETTVRHVLKIPELE